MFYKIIKWHVKNVENAMTVIVIAENGAEYG